MSDAARIERSLLDLLRGEHSSLTIGFNENHAPNYLTAQESEDHYGADLRVDWVSDDERIKAFANNTVWTCHWYPDSPVGFNCIGASSLPALLTALVDYSMPKERP